MTANAEAAVTIRRARLNSPKTLLGDDGTSTPAGTARAITTSPIPAPRANQTSERRAMSEAFSKPARLVSIADQSTTGAAAAIPRAIESTNGWPSALAVTPEVPKG